MLTRASTSGLPLQESVSEILKQEGLDNFYNSYRKN